MEYVRAAAVLAVDGWGDEVQYCLASDPHELEKTLRVEVPRHKQELEGLRICWLWTSKTLRDKGNICAAKIGTMNDRVQAMLYELGDVDSPPHFCADVNIEIWLDMSDKQRLAVVDHEMCHCELGPSGPRIVGHDVQEFRGVVERHGLYSRQLEKMAEVMQLSLPGMDKQSLEKQMAKAEAELQEIFGAMDRAAGTSVTLSTRDQSVTMGAGEFESLSGKLAGMTREQLAGLTSEDCEGQASEDSDNQDGDEPEEEAA